jgi:hypothetical protein
MSLYPEAAARHSMTSARIDFGAVSAAALGCSELIVRRWLPAGKREGREWVALNPKRADRRFGSFKVNLTTGKWADFATGDPGGRDLISLAAYLFSISQSEAARRLAEMLGLPGNAP